MMATLLVSKNVLLVMSLTMCVTLQIMVGVVSGRLLDNTKIHIMNNMSHPFTMHGLFRDDNGFHTLQPGESYRYVFYKYPLWNMLWSLTFHWNGSEYYKYNIYDSRRDSCYQYNCYWQIIEDGPCQIVHNYTEPLCFSWNY
ncbi:putative cupredoxin, plant self-incompatibility S1 [Lupinus albus]|uniref:Putative cupredoxin, plant self-incompatibility S1 n=1 Tax=Lupinus albus TaxID=3870 RepID=A0A6A4QFU2_LUPAL|nr:putative cupredoxin, plant self-incompatibility S1 [Lupinus albus]